MSSTLALDGLVYGIEELDALLVLHLGDAHLHSAWVRPDAGLRAEDVVAALRDAYRVGQFAARRIAAFGASPVERRGEVASPLITLELPSRTALLRRVRSHVVACLFDGALPLGMARMIAARLVTALEPELPLDAATAGALEPLAPIIRAPRPGDAEEHHERGPTTLTFGAGQRRSRPPSRAVQGELDRTRRLLAYLEGHAPEPHVVRMRLALRAGLTLASLDHLEALGPETLVLLETAVEEILGVDRAELRRLA